MSKILNYDCQRWLKLDPNAKDGYTHTNVVAVLTADCFDKRAVYRAIVDEFPYDNEEEQERLFNQILAKGDKLTFNQALNHFPSLEQGEYRR